jgi:hypothetical protein
MQNIKVIRDTYYKYKYILLGSNLKTQDTVY